MAPLSGRNPRGSSELESWAEWGYGRQRRVLFPSPSRSHSAHWLPHGEPLRNNRLQPLESRVNIIPPSLSVVLRAGKMA